MRSSSAGDQPELRGGGLPEKFERPPPPTRIAPVPFMCNPSGYLDYHTLGQQLAADTTDHHPRLKNSTKQSAGIPLEVGFSSACPEL
jgi:hypothetical protein